jgi:DNA (cytosine-5)-methyltransferase 1
LRSQAQCSHAADKETFVTHTLKAEHDASEDGTGRGTPIIPVAFDPQGAGNQSNLGASEDGTGALGTTKTPAIAFSGRDRGDDGRGYGRDPQVFKDQQVGSLDTVKPHCVAIQERATSENLGQGPDGKGFRDDNQAYTLEGRQTPQAVAFAENSRGEVRLEGSDGLRSGSVSGGGGKAGQGHPAIFDLHTVRRLTPLECERLQGFLDNWTLIPDYRSRARKGSDRTETISHLIGVGFSEEEAETMVDHPDGPRYRAIGNSMAVPVMRWIGERIQGVERMVSE